MDDPRTDDDPSAPSTSVPLQESDHELLPEYAFPDCTSACSALVLGLGESSTLAPLTRLFKDISANAVPDDDFSERRLAEKIRVASALRVVLGCVESAGLYFSLQGAREVVDMAADGLESARVVCGMARRGEGGVGKRGRGRVRQLSVLLQLELMKVLLMMARRYVEVFREEGEGNWTGALAATLLTMWVEGEGEVATMVPTSWVRDGVSEAVRKDGSLLESVMSGLSLVGSSLSGLGLGSMRIGLQHDESDENDDDGQDGGRDDGADAGPSPRAHANPNPNPNPTSTSTNQISAHKHAGYDVEHPVQTLSALLTLTMCFAAPAFKASLGAVCSDADVLSPKSLLATSSKRMAVSESSRLLFYALLQNNEEFMNYCMARTDVDVIVMPLLERLYKHVDMEGTSMDELYIVAILLLVLTGDSAFVASANGSVMKDRDVAWYTARNVKGIRLDSLMLLVLLHVAMVTTYSPTRRDVYLHTNALAAIANMAPTMRDMHPVACQRLMAVLEKLGSTAARLRGGLEVAVDREMLGLVDEFRSLIFEVINAVIENCLNENVALVYAMLHKRSAIDRYRGADGGSGGDGGGNQELRELSENACAVVEYFGRLLPPSDTPASIERIQEIIKEGMKSFRHDQLPMNASELRFGYEEEADSSTFFLPYIDEMIATVI